MTTWKVDKNRTKTEAKHTATPWSISNEHEDTRKSESTFTDSKFIWSRGIVSDAHILKPCRANGLTEEQADANADFIVRAVNSYEELLEACKLALEYLESQNTPRNLQEAIAFKTHQRAIIKQAIAKAEGK